MNDSSAKIVSASIIFSALLVVAAVWHTSIKKNPDLNAALKSIAESQLKINDRLLRIEQERTDKIQIPTPAMPEKNPQETPIKNNATSSPPTTGTLPNPPITFTWNEFEAEYPSTFKLEQTQTGWQLNGSSLVNISIECPTSKLTSYPSWNFTEKAHRSYDRRNGRAWDAVLYEGTEKSRYEGEPEYRLYIIQGAWDQASAGKNGCSIALTANNKTSKQAFTEAYALAQQIYQSIK